MELHRYISDVSCHTLIHHARLFLSVYFNWKFTLKTICFVDFKNLYYYYSVARLTYFHV